MTTGVTRIDRSIDESISVASTIRQKRPIRRNRESHACTTCRVRKLKCDKGLPCGSCARRNESTSCFYRHKDEGAGSSERRVGAEERLDRLESLVKKLVSSFGNDHGQPLQTTSAITKARVSGSASDSEDTEDDRPIYVGSTHWSAMLDDIKELKAVLQSGTEDESVLGLYDILPGRDTDILFGHPQQASLQDIMSVLLPSKTVLDRCVSAYFRSRSIAGPFIHTTQFMRQYKEFMSDPLSMSPLWVSMLFSICYLSTKVSSSLEGDDGSQAHGSSKEEQYLIGAAQCLTLGRYYQPKRFALESVTLFIQCRCVHKLDPSREIAVLLGVMIQLAHMMGYHRDPAHMTSLTPFEKEMRRRTWTLCVQLELLLSFQLGIPTNIQTSSWDTKMPANLVDTDFDEDTVTMPDSRPESEPTRILFFVAKQKLMIDFQKVFKHALASGYYNEAELNILDKEIRETYLNLPHNLRAYDPLTPFIDESYLIAARHCVEFIYQKSLCVLHRKYIMHGREESVQVSLLSASNIVQRFLSMYREFKPGGQLCQDRWLFGSILWNDYLLGVNVLCLILASHNRQHSTFTEKRRPEIEELLVSAYQVCSENLDSSQGALKVCKLLQVVLSPVILDLALRNSHTGDIGGSKLLDTSTTDSFADMIQNSATDTGGEDVLAASSVTADLPQGMDWSDTFVASVEGSEWSYMQEAFELPETSQFFMNQ